jgi:hypothetical protein
LKFDTLLAQFLYQNKKLALPGIGTFTLDGSSVLMDENAKIKAPLEGISFTTSSPALPDTALIDFIRTHTGKMKSLAEADLDSYLTLAQQFINIGKPLYLEGIGTIQRIKNSFEFIPGTPSMARLEPVADRQMEGRRRAAFDEEEAAQREKGGSSARKILLLLGIAGTLALIAWGGYYMYSKSNNNTETATENIKIIPETDTTQNQLSNVVQDTLSGINPVSDSLLKKDSLAPSTPPPVPAAVAALATGNYKFVIETAGKERAMSRYATLKRDGSAVTMETKDSITFKLFFILPATAMDTTRLKDSLNSYFNYDNQTKRFKRLTTIEN